MKRLLVVALTATLSTVVLAAENKKLSFDVSGAFWAGCAGKLTATLGEGGLKEIGKIDPNGGATPVRTNAVAADDADLGALADKVNKAETPHKAKAAPGVALVLFAKLDKDSAKKAEEAVGKVKGVDGKGSKANAGKGEISVKLDGKAKVMVKNLVDALKDAGISASIEKEKDKK